MSLRRNLFLLAAIATLVPLSVNWAHAESGYTAFKPTQRQLNGMLSRTFKVCLDNAGGATAAINACTDAEFVRVDRHLNTSYQARIARLSRTGIQRLRSDQRGWLATRDEACLNDLQEERDGGGTIYSILLGSCRLQELQRRVLWIERR
jgi:uncharacterized protein YecT (DUF1311 family)